MMGDPVKADATMKALIGTEKRLFRAFHRMDPATLQSRCSGEVSRGGSLMQSELPSQTAGLGASSSTAGLQTGDAVRIIGMSRRKELNGRLGSIVEGEPDEHGRVRVQFLPPLSGAT